MPITGNYLFIVAMDVTAEKEALFNEVYDTEHVPLLLKVPGVVSVTRAKLVPLSVMMAGKKTISSPKASPSIPPSMKSTAPTCCFPTPGPMRWNRAAGRKKCGPLPATGAMCCAR